MELRQDLPKFPSRKVLLDMTKAKNISHRAQELARYLNCLVKRPEVLRCLKFYELFGVENKISAALLPALPANSDPNHEVYIYIFIYLRFLFGVVDTGESKPIFVCFFFFFFWLTIHCRTGNGEFSYDGT